MPDALKTVGQAVEQEATDELVRVRRHQSGCVAMTIVVPAEAHDVFVTVDQAAFGDGNAGV